MLSATSELINPLDENIDQTNPAAMISSFAKKGRKALVMATMRAARFIGNTQYPSRHNDEKKVI